MKAHIPRNYTLKIIIKHLVIDGQGRWERASAHCTTPEGTIHVLSVYIVLTEVVQWRVSSLHRGSGHRGLKDSYLPAGLACFYLISSLHKELSVFLIIRGNHVLHGAAPLGNISDLPKKGFFPQASSQCLPRMRNTIRGTELCHLLHLYYFKMEV